MSLLSQFLVNHLLPNLANNLVPALEAAFAAHEPEMKAAFVNEIQALTNEVGQWLEAKVEAVQTKQ